LLELARCIRIDKGISDTVDIVMLATIQYNNRSIHSVIKRRSADIVLTQPDEPHVDFHNRIQKAERDRENASPQNRVFDVSEKV